MKIEIWGWCIDHVGKCEPRDCVGGTKLNEALNKQLRPFSLRHHFAYESPPTDPFTLNHPLHHYNSYCYRVEVFTILPDHLYDSAILKNKGKKRMPAQ